MRPGPFLSALLIAAPGFAQDARITFLSKQLTSGTDPRTRAQTALILGKSNSPAAVAPLCAALKDPEPVVRSAVVGALGELKAPDALTCLKTVKNESDPTVRAALARALEAPAPPGPDVKNGGLYIAILPVNDKIGALTPDVLALAESLIREKLTGMGATMAPPGESKAAASALISKHALRGYQLNTNLLPNGEGGLKLEILIMTYPDMSLQGTFNVKARGGKYETLLKAMVPRVVNDAATELEWK